MQGQADGRHGSTFTRRQLLPCDFVGKCDTKHISQAGNRSYSSELAIVPMHRVQFSRSKLYIHIYIYTHTYICTIKVYITNNS